MYKNALNWYNIKKKCHFERIGILKKKFDRIHGLYISEFFRQKIFEIKVVEFVTKFRGFLMSAANLI